MNLLQDIITYIRRIIKSPSNSSITDNLLIDYINRFWIMDVDARIQLFDLKTKYQFQTVPGLDSYNMPLYNLQTQPGNQTIGSFPVYQGFMAPARINGITCPFYTTRQDFYDLWPNYTQQLVQAATGDGTSGPYTINLTFFPAIPGHVDINGIISSGVAPQDPIYATTLNLNVPTTSVYSCVYFTATGANGQNIIVADSGQFLSNNADGDIYGLLMSPGTAPLGNTALFGNYSNSFAITGATQATQAVLTTTTTFQPGQVVQIAGVSGMIELNGLNVTVVANGGTTLTIDVNSLGFTPYISGGTVSAFQNVINYNTGVAKDVFFPAAIPASTPITAQCYFIQPGLPRGVLFYNNIITLRNPPDKQYLVELDAYLSPAAFLNTSSAIPFGYMAEYIARGAARKILSDTGDAEQLNFYEPMFREQEALVHIRSQRQFTATRTQTIYSTNGFQSNYNQSSMGT
jgi:hypothetical protein